MRFTSNGNEHARGFTLIEMLVIAPIVILMIGAFVSMMVAMTGEVIAMRAHNTMAYDTQAALDRIEQDVRFSGALLAGNDFSLQSPQGYTGGTGASFNFENISSDKGTMLLLRSFTTDKNPLDPTRQLIYTNQPSGSCSADVLASNQPFTSNIVYFVKNNTLWRRTLVQQGSGSPTLCGTPWQLPSCQPGATRGSYCKVDDQRILDNVSSLTIQYYNGASSTAADATAANVSAADSTRSTAIANDDTVAITLSTEQTAAGRTINYDSSLRVTKLNTISPITITSSPADTTALTSDTNVTFTASTSDANATVQWQQSVDKGTTWTNIVGATTPTLTLSSVNMGMDGNLYRAVFADNAGQAISNSARLTVNYLQWSSFVLQNSWSDYSTGYNSNGYRKTTDGVVILKGLIKRSGTPTQLETIGVLPPGYRPSGILVFTTSTSPNDVGRIDVYPTGEVKFYSGSGAWISLEGISFLPATSPYTQTGVSFSSGWQNYGGSYAPVTYAADRSGRVHLQGLTGGGTNSADAKMFGLPTNLLPSEYLHLPEGNTTYSLIGIDPRSSLYGVAARGVGTGSWIATQALYYPASYTGWTDLTLQGGWTRYDTTLNSSPQFTKASDGIVTVKGLIKGGSTTSGSVIATLPPGYRPAVRVLYDVTSSNAYARLDILPTGDILFMTGYNNWYALDGINFYADQ